MLRKKLWMWFAMMAVMTGCAGAAKAPDARSAPASEGTISVQSESSGAAPAKVSSTPAQPGAFDSVQHVPQMLLRYTSWVLLPGAMRSGCEAHAVPPL